MSHRERIEAMYSALANGNPSAVLPELHPDVEYRNPPTAVEGGVRRGPEAFVEAITAVSDALGNPRYEIVSFEESQSTVTTVVQIVGSGGASGVPVNALLVHRFELRDGLLYSLEWEPAKEDR